MRHVGFVVGLAIAGFVFLILSLPLAMNECQLSDTEAAARACFANAHRGGQINAWTAVGFLILAVVLHVAKSRWAFAALAGLAVGPCIAWAFIA